MNFMPNFAQKVKSQTLAIFFPSIAETATELTDFGSLVHFLGYYKFLG